MNAFCVRGGRWIRMVLTRQEPRSGQPGRPFCFHPDGAIDTVRLANPYVQTSIGWIRTGCDRRRCFLARIEAMSASYSGLRRIARAYLWSIAAWMAFAPLLAGQDKVRLLERGQDTSYWILMLVNAAWLMTAAILTPPIFWLVSRYPLPKAGPWRAAAFLLGSVPYVLVAAFLRWVLMPPWDSAGQHFGPRTLHGLLQGTYIFANLIWDYVLIVFAAQAYWYFKDSRDQEIERAQLQQALAASELQLLKSQLHPHFLFNTLHGISALIDVDRERAKGMILKLSNLLRTTLEHGDADLIPLDDELKFLENYLALEKLRLEERLDVKWDIASGTGDLLVPQLILQPLVENAILHGIACSRTGGWVEIRSLRRNQNLEIQIRNSVGGKRTGGMGLGLQNTRARLKHLYCDEAVFSFELVDGSEAAATLLLPGMSSRLSASEEACVDARQTG